MRNLQEKIMNTRNEQDVRALQAALDNKGHARYQSREPAICDFIITDPADAKAGVHDSVSPVRKIASRYIIKNLNENFGNDYISVAIRGDMRCSQRSLMAGALIVARRLIYQGHQALANNVLDKLNTFSDELKAQINEPKFEYLKEDFTEEQYQRIKALLESIRNGETGISDLVLQANHDFSKEVVPHPDPLNLALSALTVFIMYKQYLKHEFFNIYTDDGMTEENAIRELRDNDGHLLKPGTTASPQPDRIQFSSALGLGCKTAIINVNACESAITNFNNDHPNVLIQSEDDDRINALTLQDETSEEFMNAPGMTLVNSTGHTILILTRDDRELMEQELRQRRALYAAAHNCWSWFLDAMAYVCQSIKMAVIAICVCVLTAGQATTGYVSRFFNPAMPSQDDEANNDSSHRLNEV